MKNYNQYYIDERGAHTNSNLCDVRATSIYRNRYIAYERDEKGGFIASAPAIPGCVVYGKTLKEAYKNICSAIEECLAVIMFHKKYV